MMMEKSTKAEPIESTKPKSDATKGAKGETIGDALKFLGFAIIVQPVAAIIAFLSFNMAKENYERLPNPIAFVMMIVAGGFVVLSVVAGPGCLISAIVFCVRVIARRGGSKK